MPFELVADRGGQLVIVDHSSLPKAVWRAVEMIWGGRTRVDRIIHNGRTVASERQLLRFADEHRWLIWLGR